MSTSAFPEFENSPASHLPTKVFKGHTDAIRSVAYFIGGKRIVSGSRDKTVRLWNVESGKQEGRSLEHEFVVECISISPDEQTLAACGEDRVVLWNLESRSVVWTIADTVDGYRVAFSPDGQLIAATASNDIVLLGAETGARIREPLQFGEDIWCLAFSPDGAQLAAGSNQGNVRVFDVATRKTVLGSINAHTARVTSVLFTPDGKQIVTASLNKSIRIWDSSTGQEVGNPMQGHERIQQIALSHDGCRLASAAYAGTVRIWGLNSWRQLGDSLKAQEKYPSFSVAWSSDGQSVIAGDGNGMISLWNVAPLEVEDSGATMPPVVVAGNPPQPSSSRLRTGSLSPSLLDLRAGAPLPKQPYLNPPPLPDDFWDSSDSELPALVRPPILSVPRDERPAAKQPIPASTKTTPATAVSASPANPPINLFARIFAHFRHDKHDAEDIEMRPPRASHLPTYSPVVKVPLAEADARLYTPGQKKEPEPVDDGDVSEESIRDDGCLNAICFCEFFKWLKYRRELRREERQRQERRERRRQEREAQAAQEHQSQPSLIAEGENQAGSAST